MPAAIVTGADSGIGKATAVKLAERGFDLGITWHSEEDRAESAIEEIERLGRRCGVRHLDLHAVHEGAQAVDELAEELGGVDALVNNAAYGTSKPFLEMELGEWQGVIDVNLTGAFRVVQACVGGMRDRAYGRIVVISSGAARSGLPGQVAYAASKAGLIGMVRTLAAENAGRGITVNAVLPGMVATEKVLAMPPGVLERVRAALPSGRMVEPAEVAALVAFLASPEAGQITGEEIGIAGGLGLGLMSLGSPRD